MLHGVRGLGQRQPLPVGNPAQPLVEQPRRPARVHPDRQRPPPRPALAEQPDRVVVAADPLRRRVHRSGDCGVAQDQQPRLLDGGGHGDHLGLARHAHLGPGLHDRRGVGQLAGAEPVQRLPRSPPSGAQAIPAEAPEVAGVELPIPTTSSTTASRAASAAAAAPAIPARPIRRPTCVTCVRAPAEPGSPREQSEATPLIRRRRVPRARCPTAGGTAEAWSLVSQSPSTAANRSGCSTWGRCPQSGNSDSRPWGSRFDRGLGVVGGQDVVAAAPDDQGGRGQGGEVVEQDLALPGQAEQGAGHRGGGLELAGAASEGVLFGEELGGGPPGLGEQHRRRHGGAAPVAAGQAADHDGQFADHRQGVQGEQRVYLAAEARAVDQGQARMRCGVGQGQA